MGAAEILDRIIKEAKKWNGIEEIQGNMGWENQLFEDAMEQVGWNEGQAWCAFFVKMIYYKVFMKTEYGIHIMKDFVGSATKTFENCENSPVFRTDVVHPVPGCVVIWRRWDNGKRDWRGHAGIVIEAGGGEIGSHFTSIEGNTNNEGTRVGKEVAIRTRMNNHGNIDGLVVEGFIFPPIPLHKLDPKYVML
jgi:hypothetical protein